MNGSAGFNLSTNRYTLHSTSFILMGSSTSAETAVTLQMFGLPLRSCGRKASTPGLGPSIARRKTLRGLLRVSIDLMQAKFSSLIDSNSRMTVGEAFDRRKLLLASFIGLSIDAFQNALINGMAIGAEFADMPALRGKDYGKTKMRYSDYTETQSGLQYKDLREGDGPKPKMGEIVVVDWDGYTIGYYGRIFEARNKTKGGSFEGEDKDFFKFKLGSQQVIPAFEEAITGMSLGGIRRHSTRNLYIYLRNMRPLIVAVLCTVRGRVNTQIPRAMIIVPPELGYPDNDFNKLGPRPTTFSGQRALDFVLRNKGLIDKTLLFDIELLKIISN